jgi:hypothetical protein
MNHDQRWKPLREREKHRLQIRYNINWSNLLLICNVEVPLMIRQQLLLIDETAVSPSPTRASDTRKIISLLLQRLSTVPVLEAFEGEDKATASITLRAGTAQCSLRGIVQELQL